MKVVYFLAILFFTPKVWSQDPGYPTAPPIPSTITAAEYFIDNDPGIGRGNPIAVVAGTNITIPATLTTEGLLYGVHRLFLRTRNSEGVWSLTHSKEFLVDFDPPYPTTSVAPTVTAAEYFIDNDPGWGNGIAIAVSPATNLVNMPVVVSTAGLNVGIHRLFLRSRDAAGVWSQTSMKEFLVDENPAYPLAPTAPGNLVFAEYFFDTDPGFGKGQPIAFTPSTNLTNYTAGVNVSGLSEGNHIFFIRTLDDWSLTGYQAFLVGTPLPLRLLSFYAKNREQDVWLEWKTESEQATSHFDVERSANGTQFKRVAMVTAVNQPGTHVYQYTDGQPQEGKTYYRLKQVDKDGKADYSKTLVVSRGNGVELQVFPNPATDKVIVLLPFQNTAQTVTLLNAQAQPVRFMQIGAGTTQIECPLAGLPAGRYFIKWIKGDDVQIKAFIKQ